MEKSGDNMEDITYTNPSNGKKAVVVDFANSLQRHLSDEETRNGLTVAQVKSHMKKYIKRLVFATEENNVSDLVVVCKNMPLRDQSHRIQFAEIVITKFMNWQAELNFTSIYEGGACCKITILWVANDSNKGRDDAMTYWAFNYLRGLGYEVIRLSHDLGRDAHTFQNTAFKMHEIECFKLVDAIMITDMPNEEELAHCIQSVLADLTMSSGKTIQGADYTPDQIQDAVHTRLDQTSFVEASGIVEVSDSDDDDSDDDRNNDSDDENKMEVEEW